ncbi:hypothetical protein E2C01_101341 [Portunus trituberculatus]|uniref:Uncharacterized protein n=1 Tax=Portunus trituberculatus TaxID=210409 RepID=A0A5B7KEI2_PORTR|nr:hypothetical protein [Portunus trituberculatus]
MYLHHHHHHHHHHHRERQEKKQDIRSNILEGIVTLTQQMDVLGVPLGLEENQAAKDYILAINPEDFTYTEARRRILLKELDRRRERV